MNKKIKLDFNYFYHLGKLRPSTRFEVENEGKNFKLSFLCLIDSGTDKTISFYSLGKDLGIDFKGASVELINGIGQNKCPSCKKPLPQLQAYRKPINIFINNQVGKIKLDVLWLIKEFDSLREFPFLIGRETFFEKFDVTFSEKNKKFSLESVF